MNKIILVMGMHRSGTSAFARLLDILGVDLGTNLLKGHPEINAAGFWENKSFIDIHDQILKSLDSAWFDGRPLPVGWWLDPQIQFYASEIKGVLERDFKNRSLFAVKDPRLSRLLPFWLDIIKGLDISPRCIIVLRNPKEVVESLCKRDGFDGGLVCYLWLVHVLEAEYYTRSVNRSIVTYDEILEEWRNAVSRIADEAGIEWPKSVSEVDDVIGKEISRKLRHHYAADTEENTQDGFAGKALEVYDKMVNGQLSELREYLDETRSGLTEFEPLQKSLVDALFRTNFFLTEKSKALIDMGEKHSEALNVISERDIQLQATQKQLNRLGKEHSHALNVVSERDSQLQATQKQLNRLGKEHSKALEVIAERDRQLDSIRSHWLWPVARHLLRRI